MKFLKSIVFVCVIIVALATVGGCDSASEPTATEVVASIAPDFTLTDMAGKEVSLSQFKGQVVILNFWATWCPPCKDEMPSMEQLYREYKDQGLVILAVNVEKNGRESVAKFLQKTPHSFPILIDDKKVSSDLYKVFRYPESFLIDRNGIMVDKIIGGRDWMSKSILDKIKFLLGG